MNLENYHGVWRAGGNSSTIVNHVMQERKDILNRFYSVQSDVALYQESQVADSLRFVLHDVRQGIYVLIRGGKVRFVISIANLEFENTFSKIYQCQLTDWACNKILCNQPSDHKFGWGVGMLKDIRAMLVDVTQTVTTKDCEFILNRRDLPMLRKDGESCYSFAGARKPKYYCHLPIVSLYQGNSFYDFPMIEPTPPQHMKHVPWNDKKEIAFFRGSATGAGIDKHTNARIALAWLSHEHRKQKMRSLDAGLVGLTSRIKFTNRGLLKDSQQNVPGFVSRVKMEEWSRYKYIIYAEGYSAALRMGSMLSSKSVVIILKDQYSEANKLWYFNQLNICDYPNCDAFTCVVASKQFKTNAHVIAVFLKDLPELVIWLRSNDHVARILGENAYALYQSIASKRLQFMHTQLNSFTAN